MLTNKPHGTQSYCLYKFDSNVGGGNNVIPPSWKNTRDILPHTPFPSYATLFHYHKSKPDH